MKKKSWKWNVKKDVLKDALKDALKVNPDWVH